MAVLIAIEIFRNVTIYVQEDVIDVEIVVATALMAVARKVIILILEQINSLDLFGLAALVIAASVAYWLVLKTPGFSVQPESHGDKVDDWRDDVDDNDTLGDNASLPEPAHLSDRHLPFNGSVAFPTTEAELCRVSFWLVVRDTARGPGPRSACYSGVYQMGEV